MQHALMQGGSSTSVVRRNRTGPVAAKVGSMHHAAYGSVSCMDVDSITQQAEASLALCAHHANRRLTPPAPLLLLLPPPSPVLFNAHAQAPARAAAPALGHNARRATVVVEAAKHEYQVRWYCVRAALEGVTM